MKKEIILKVENISKQYRLGTLGTGTISHDLNRWWAQIRGKEDPYLKVGETNDRSKKGESEYVWALKDINFEVERGEVLGIIGKNGAGKSTLLKILSKVTGPSTGSIKSRGRIASLLEVGTGFHPEMTGRENIFLNGAILGMTKKEINAKIDEIIEFSGCERYIDTPTKRYSSGMTVRLAFAVAAFLEPDILVVDEVLAVGDAEFQKKAIGKMQDISNTDGRTVLFVSHNMSAVKSLCTRGVVLNSGKVVFTGNVGKAIEYYLKNNKVPQFYVAERSSKTNKFNKIYLTDEMSNNIDTPIQRKQKVFLNFEVNANDISGLRFGTTLFSNMNEPIISFPFSEKENFNELILNYHLKIQLPTSILKGGDYFVEAALWKVGQIYDQSDEYISFNVIGDSTQELSGEGIKGVVINNEEWIVKDI
ncbi:lipopolysaccharide transport system ATP-binding protein [Wenyingzhuangia heitensis]|uniref:Lipopolysaccharide transport system ATP-binding protein n=1 Tax=Wenyingzhuangia heitensis TaxID=1487859 RepID=A0ABX0UEF2_9FLAO|nr:ABC transporter ATP-binding protein [Wenyingzhuangia heitensis]NIJ45422.1 lipopolysaccharide transport system ATP-binding protein [Wenyingzhuangia heitensis]